MNEQFSAFLDGEATRDEADSVLNSLLRDSGLLRCWSHQHWLRTTLRSHTAEAALALDSGFADRVMHAISIDVKPEHMSGTHTTVTAGKSARSSQTRMPRRRRWRNMASLAAVASATGIVLLVSNPMRTEDDVMASGMPATASPVATSRRSAETDARRFAVAGAPSSAMAGSLGVDAQAVGDRIMSSANAGTRTSGAHAQQVADAVGSSDHWSVSDPQIADELNGYLVDHNGLARSYGLSGTTPALVRVATYGQVATQ